MRLLSCLGLILALSSTFTARAQWNTQWLQNEGYWGDGKAEFNIYEAREMRYGQIRRSNVIHIFEREVLAPDELVPATDPKQAGTFPVLMLNQVIYIPTGVFSHQWMHSSYWKLDSGALVKATLSGNDSIGNTYKEFVGLSGWRSWFQAGWTAHWHTYLPGQSAGEARITAERDATFYDELPMRIRTIDFSADSGAFAVPLAPTVIDSAVKKVEFSPHTIEWRRKTLEPAQPGSSPVSGTITIIVKPRAGKGEDIFQIDASPPHLLQEWRKRDGGILRLQKSFKIDYRNMNKLGDLSKLLEKAREEHAAEHESKERDAQEAGQDE